MNALPGKTVLITGANAGIGKEVARQLALRPETGRIYLACRNKDRAITAKAELEAATDRHIFDIVLLDVADMASVEAAVGSCVAAFGGLHVLYNNAAVSLPDDDGPTTTDEMTWNTTMDINVKGVWLCCKAGIPVMLDSGGGSIINVASFVAHVGAATPQLAYTTSKGAVLAMTREIAVEYARRGIRCNALCPGPVLTPLLTTYLSDEARRQRRLVHVPMGRFGEPEEIVRGALFLASDDSSYMTGQSLLIDGGITAAYTTPE